jgi:hypothetical protein
MPLFFSTKLKLSSLELRLTAVGYSMSFVGVADPDVVRRLDKAQSGTVKFPALGGLFDAQFTNMTMPL